MAQDVGFQSDVLGVNAQVTLAASRMLDKLIVGEVGKVELNLGSHVLELRTKKARKKATATKKVTRKKSVNRRTGKVVKRK